MSNDWIDCMLYHHINLVIDYHRNLFLKFDNYPLTLRAEVLFKV